MEHCRKMCTNESRITCNDSSRIILLKVAAAILINYHNLTLLNNLGLFKLLGSYLINHNL